MHFKTIFPFVIINFFIACTAAGQNNYDSSLIGVWKGTSLCQVKNSPCHDETVVYYISKVGADSFSIRANKIVNGIEEEMGIIPGTFNSKQRELTCSPRPNTVWKFKLTGRKLEGTLYQNEQL